MASDGHTDEDEGGGNALEQKPFDFEHVAVITRIHLGKAASPPSEESLTRTVSGYRAAFGGVTPHVAVAVDAGERFSGYDLPSEVRKVSSSLETTTTMTIIPVTPWGKFVPALNAAVAWASQLQSARWLLVVSAETSLSTKSLGVMCDAMDDETTLVVGAVLEGHEYVKGTRQPLNGRTTPWNTAALWNMRKLSLTGFPLVADGLVPNDDGSPGPSGVEEVSTIALLQSVLPPNTAEAKLVQLPDVEWNTKSFEGDPERRKWHEQKMASKVERAERHLSLLGLRQGCTVLHL